MTFQSWRRPNPCDHFNLSARSKKRRSPLDLALSIRPFKAIVILGGSCCITHRRVTVDQTFGTLLASLPPPKRQSRSTRRPFFGNPVVNSTLCLALKRATLGNAMSQAAQTNPARRRLGKGGREKDVPQQRPSSSPDPVPCLDHHRVEVSLNGGHRQIESRRHAHGSWMLDLLSHVPELKGVPPTRDIVSRR